MPPFQQWIRSVIFVKTTAAIAGFCLGLLLGAGIGWVTAPLFVVPFYIVLEVITSYSRYDVDPMPLVFWYIIVLAIITAGFCSIVAARLCNRQRRPRESASR